MGITVKIEVDDQGQYSVGVDTADQDTGGAKPGMGPRMMAGGMPMDDGKEDSGMQPVANIDAALSIAKDLLTNPQAAEQAPGAAAPPGAGGDQMWNKVRAARQMQNQPGGPMMGKMG